MDDSRIQEIRTSVLAAIQPLKTTRPSQASVEGILFRGIRTKAGSALPDYYLVYFLLVDLLGFARDRYMEKTAWSIPVDLNGRLALVEHRKLGLGIFAPSSAHVEVDATEICRLIGTGVRIASPYFQWRADQASMESKLNVENKSALLYRRFQFFLNLYREKRSEVAESPNSTAPTFLRGGVRIALPGLKLDEEIRWLSLATIDSFFGWTEHVFILLAILQGKCVTGAGVERLASGEWRDKFMAALDIRDIETKRYYDELILVRRQLRNVVAHGAFGKQREAFQFHSMAGAVPMRLPDGRGDAQYRFGHGIDFVDHEAIELILSFVEHMWSGVLAPAQTYLDGGYLPLILTMAQSGEYSRAMRSEEAMRSLTERLTYEFDRAADMDY